MEKTKRTERDAKNPGKMVSRRRMLGCLGVVLGAPAAGSLYCFGIEPALPGVEEVSLSLFDFPGSLHAVQLSDLHMKGPSRLYEKVASRIGELNPEIIFLTGDLVDKPEHLDSCLEWIARLPRGQGLYFSPGNWERWSGTWKGGLREKLAAIGVQSLCNEGRVIQTGDGEFFLTGIDDAYYGQPRIHEALADQSSEMCTILLSHSPLGVDRIGRYRIDLVLSGHTHGGQCRLPGIGSIVTPPGSGPYDMGLFRTEGTLLYVNRGIGTSILPVRFLCRPEITSLRIERRQ